MIQFNIILLSNQILGVLFYNNSCPVRIYTTLPLQRTQRDIRHYAVLVTPSPLQNRSNQISVSCKGILAANFQSCSWNIHRVTAGHCLMSAAQTAPTDCPCTRYERMEGSKGIAPIIPDLNARWSKQSTPRPGSFTPGKEPGYPLKTR